ncbi:MAG: riboflavin biosynthesis protein RibF [Clostridiales bacterium]|nr:riboflavin biosynthesis protein RibF [Clostridiales bacterium]
MMSNDGYAAVVGTFDGVHLGHRYLLDDLKSRASRRGLGTRIYTFTGHPLTTLCPERAPRLLTTAVEKLELLDSIGVDFVYMADFSTVASMTAREYVELLASQGVRLLLVGHDNRFGSDGLVEFSQFVEAARCTGVEIEQAAELTTPDGRDINSSRIRSLITGHNISQANELLGYEYRLTGKVVHGKQLGRTIGFPTANVQLPPLSQKLQVPNGVYACRTVIDGETIPVMVNIGHRPTVDRADSLTSIEAHLIGYDADLYGQLLTLRFVRFLRHEQRFASLEELKAALVCDRDATLAIVH